MELKRLVVESSGGVEATWVLEPAQVSMLVEYAISDLIARGVASVADISEEQLEKLKAEAVAKRNEEEGTGADVAAAALSKLN